MSTTPMLDKMVERIQAMPLEEAVVLLMERNEAVKRAYEDKPLTLKKAIWNRAIAKRAVEGMGVTVRSDETNGNIYGVSLPILGYLTETLKEREAVSIPEVGQVKGHSYYDPCEEALIRSGGLTDLGTFSFEEWVKDV